MQVMSQARTPSLRKTTKDPATGQVNHRRSTGHVPPPPLTPSPKPSSLRLSQRIRNTSQSPALKPSKMPTAETQMEHSSSIRDEELHKKVDGLATGLAESFNTVEKVCEGFQTLIEFTQEEVQDLKEENLALKETLKELSLEIQRNTYAIQKLGTKHENLEVITKKKNLIFEGVPEHQGGRENIHEPVCNILSEMDIHKAIDYEAAYRLGQKPGKYPRPVFIAFGKLNDRNLVFANMANLRSSRNLSRV